MIDVGGNNHAAAGDFVAHQFGRELFAVRDVAHFLGDQALTGIMHLGKIAVSVGLLAARDPLRARFGDAVTVGAIVGFAVRKKHVLGQPSGECTGPDYTRTEREIAPMKNNRQKVVHAHGSLIHPRSSLPSENREA